jgi:hypothetical protein
MENNNKMPEMSIAELADILGGTIKYDDANKVIVFLGMLSAYTEEDQLNICLMGPSSSGKSYIAKEVAKFFPSDDVSDYADISPTALKYNNAVYDEESEAYLVDYERKIMVFSEMPHSQLLANMRPLLSHDDKYTEFVVTDFNSHSKDGNKARRTIIKGYPAVVFCSANTKLNNQEATRCLLLSPEVSTEKINAGVELANERNANPEAYYKRVESDSRRDELRRRIHYIKELEVQSVIIPDHLTTLQRFRSASDVPMSRHQRDISHLNSLIKAVTMLNAHRRMDEQHNLVANDNDVDIAIELWNSINESQMRGIPPVINDFYKTYIVPLYLSRPRTGDEFDDNLGVTHKEIALYYYQLNGHMPNDDDLRKNILPTLEANSLISVGKNPNDRRQHIITPLVGVETVKASDDSAPGDGTPDETDTSDERSMEDVILDIEAGREKVHKPTPEQMEQIWGQKGGQNV